MMRLETVLGCALGCVLAAGAVGCQPRVKVVAPEKESVAIAQTGVQPHGEIALVGTFDFEVVGDAAGSGCYDPTSRGGQLGIIPGVGVGTLAGGSVSRAQAAAVFDALTKMKDADTIMVTWTKIETQPDGTTCAEVHGKAIKLKKGPTHHPMMMHNGEHGPMTYDGPPHHMGPPPPDAPPPPPPKPGTTPPTPPPPPAAPK